MRAVCTLRCCLHGEAGRSTQARTIRLCSRRKTRKQYGEFLGRRYGKKGVIWIMGGDRTATGFEETWRMLARGIAIGVTGKEDYDGVLMSFHPRGSETSSTWFHNDAWLDFNMHQTGHGLAEKTMSWAEDREGLRAHAGKACTRWRAFV